MITIKPQTQNHYGYDFEFKVNNNLGRGFLTYNLLNENDDRDLLLTFSRNAIPNELRSDYNKFEEEIIMYSKYNNAIGTAKTIVNNIYSKEINLKNSAVVVYKFGPVPVFVIPENFNLTFNQVTRPCQLAVYPNIPSLEYNSKMPIGIKSDVEFLKSLNIQFDLMMRCYLEEVGEYFFEIENHSDLRKAFRNTKEAENILGESILSKIKKITSSTNGKHIDDIQKLKDELLNNYSEVIFKTKYARLFALYFINELYTMLGIAPKNYNDKFKALREVTRIITKNNHAYDQYINTDNDLLLLRTALMQYNSSQQMGTTIEDLECDSDSLWIKRFIDFAKFISTLKISYETPSFKPKIFLSHQHSIPVPEVIRTGLLDLVSNTLKNQVEILFEKGNKPGMPFEEFIKSKIWISDSTYSIIPKTLYSIDEKEKNFSWIAKESIHSQLLKNELIYLIDLDITDEQIKSLEETINSTQKYLSNDARNLDAIKKLVLEKLRARINIRFKQNNTDLLDANLQHIIHNVVPKLTEQKGLKVIEAWLNQFSEETARLILKANFILQLPTPIREATEKVLGSKDKRHITMFRNRILENTRIRKLIINGSEFELIRRTGNTKSMRYTQNIPNVFQCLTGSSVKSNELLNTLHRSLQF